MKLRREARVQEKIRNDLETIRQNHADAITEQIRLAHLAVDRERWIARLQKNIRDGTTPDPSDMRDPAQG